MLCRSLTEERFGNERLIQALNEDQVIGNSSLILRVKSAVERFAEGEPQFDDMTMVSFTFLQNDRFSSSDPTIEKEIRHASETDYK